MRFPYAFPFFFSSFLIYLTFANNYCFAQYEKSKYGVEYIKDIKNFKRLFPSEEYHLKEIRNQIPTAHYDLRYATKNNFTGKILYPSKTKHAFLTKNAIEGLKKAASIFDSLGYDIVIFDAYRPYNVTVQFWELIQNEDYVAKPTKGSFHNRGLAIDLSLWDRSKHSLVDMGTDFDHFSDTAHHGFKNLPQEVLENRLILKETMEKVGFRALSTEWWHYMWISDKEHPVLDIDFKKLK